METESPADRRAACTYDAGRTLERVRAALDKPLGRPTTEDDANAYGRAAWHLRQALGELDRVTL